MNYIFILKEEKTETIRKFNKIKKWFISNFYSNIMNKTIYVYENQIDVSAPYFLNFYMIAPNVFPMLNTCLLENALKQKNSICGDNIHTIIYLQLKDPIKIGNENTIIDFTKLYNILENLPTRIDGLIQEYHINKIDQRRWFYVEENKIPNFLDDMKNKYFTWENMNQVKLKNAHNYPKIIYYDGKNKYESKKMVEKWNIQIPKTYKQFQLLKDITQDEINKLPNCIIKPTNWDGGKYIFKNDSKCPISASKIRNDLHKFDTENIHKEIMALISRTHKPSIIAEEYIKDLFSQYTAPCEFKFYLFNGKILFILATNRKVSKKKFSFFDENFSPLPITLYSFTRNELKFKWEKPHYFDKLKKDVFLIYDNFLKDMKHTFMGKFIRIDFFINKEDYWFGEFSLFPNGGHGDNLNENGKRTFIRNWIPEVFEIFDK
jgi:hypothetical protein